VCEFVSTREKHESDIHFVAFLQNSDLETEAGKKLLAHLGTHTEDLCGHGAICEYYELQGWEFPTNTMQKEYTDLSNPTELPSVIVEAIKLGNLSRIGIPSAKSDLLNKRGMDAIEADKARSEAYKARSEADKAWSEADKAWSEAYKAWSEADKARSEADKARSEAYKARSEADKAWFEADKARSEADKAAFWRVFSHPCYRRKCWR